MQASQSECKPLGPPVGSWISLGILQGSLGIPWGHLVTHGAGAFWTLGSIDFGEEKGPQGIPGGHRASMCFSFRSITN